MFCKLCKSLNLNIEYSGPIRSGGANSKTEEGFKVWQDQVQKVAFS